MAPQHEERKQDGNAVAEPVMRWFTWEDVAQRTGQDPALQERWVVIDRKVYDISHFYRRHPGGALLISSHAGQDVTVRGSRMGRDAHHQLVLRVGCLATITWQEYGE